MSNTRPPLAVVGLDCLFPGSLDVRGFWRDVLAGADQLREIPETHWSIGDYYDPDPAAPDRTYARRGAFLDSVEFDPVGWGVPPSTISATDTSQLLALIVAQRVLAEATSGQFSSVDRARTSVILGVTGGQELLGAMVGRLQRPVWERSLRDGGMADDEVETAVERILAHYPEWQESTFPGLLGNVVAGRIANRLDLGGTNCITDAACASSLSALSMAANELYLGDADLVITGGVDTMNDVFMFMCFSKTPALSPSGDCRPFSDAADGTMLGEGLGMIAVKRLEDAERDGDRIHALIRGIGSSSDGRAKSVYAPRSSGQAHALRRCYEHAGYGPDTVELVEAHGTGTVAGDAAEFAGLRSVFEESGRDGGPWCALGAVKSLIGHTKAAAGAAGLIKAVLAARHGVLPPAAKIDAPNPALEIESSPFYLSTRQRPWVRASGGERRAGVSSFGFGGSNFHVTLSEYAGDGDRAPRLRAWDRELVVIAGEPAEVAARARAYAEDCERDGLLRHLSYATADENPGERAASAARLAIVARDEAELRDRLLAGARALNGEAGRLPPGVHVGTEPACDPNSLALLFPGQGSQYLHMGSALACAFEPVLAVWDGAASLEPVRNLHDVVFPPTAFTAQERADQAARLTATEWAQPALAAVSVSFLRMLEELALAPGFLAGHSLGELTALCAGGAFDEATLLRLARLRGELMRDAAAAAEGSMLAVELSLPALSERLRAWGIDLAVANHNSPTQVVLSGATETIEAVAERLTADGVGSVRLTVATAFHSPIVAPAAETFRDALAEVEFAAPSVPVYANSTAARYADGAVARDCLAQQIANQVRFVETIEQMYADGARVFVEAGPGSVLTRLTGSILADREHLAVALDSKSGTGLGPFLDGVARLAAAGLPVDLGALWRGYEVPDDPAAREAPRMTVQIRGSNPRRPAPPAPPPPPMPAPTAAPPVIEPAAHAPMMPPVIEPVAPAPVIQPPVPATAPPAVHGAELAAIHGHAAEVHLATVRAIADLHAAYLRTYELTITGDAPQPALTSTPAAAPGFPVPPPPVMPSSPPAPAAPRIPAMEPTQAPVPNTPDVSSIEDLTKVLLDVVAAKTGYPAEMLGMEMELEGDLGIDSIKRVEILAGMRDRVPNLPEVDTAELAELRTLAQIVAHMSDGSDAAATARDEAPALVPPNEARAPVPPNEAPAALGTPLRRTAPVAIPVARDGTGMPGLVDAQIAVTGPDAALRSALVAELTAGGIKAVDGMPAAGSADGVIVCEMLAPHTDPADTLQRSLEAFRAIRAVAAGSAPPRVLVTVQDTGGDFGLSGRCDGSAWFAGAAGLARTAAREWPEAAVRAIDIERAGRTTAQVARAITEELTSGGPELDVGLPASGERITLQDRDLGPLDRARPARLSTSDVVVVSGGGRGVTAACVAELARATGARFVLLGRTPLQDDPPGTEEISDEAGLRRAILQSADGQQRSLPEVAELVRGIRASREVRATLAAVADVGGQARYEVVDVTDGAAVRAILDAVRAEWGPITGLVHGAGVVQDKLIADKADEQFRVVFDTKVAGLRSLLDATAGDDLSLICGFSSVAARYGNPGQADYAMANEVLNVVLGSERARRDASCVVRSICWGPWAGGMVDPALRRHFEASGVAVIPLDQGARAFVAELAEPAGPAVVTIAAEGPSEAALTITVDASSHPHLIDHAIDGTVVVPVAYAVEWMARASGVLWPEKPFAGLADVRVVSGIKLPGFATGTTANIAVRAAAHDSDDALELLGPDGRVAYTATVVHADEPVSMPPEPTLAPYPDPAPYGGRSLFHGPAFHVVPSVDGIGPDGISGTVHGVTAMGWPAEPWITDPAVLDGVLQLAVLWIDRELDAPALPTGLGMIRLHRRGAVPGDVTCTLSVRDHSAISCRGDAILRDASGAVVWEVAGLEAHVLPGRR